jgi:hypothetical protein
VASPGEFRPDEPLVAAEPGTEDGVAVGAPAPAEPVAEPAVVTDAPAEPAAEPVLGPLVAELPLADGAAPLSWKGELFQGPPVPVAAARPRAEAPPPGADVFAAALAELAVGRPEPVDRVGAVLRAAESRGLVWLPGRQTPGGFVVDHLAVSPNGIWVVGAEPSPSGRVDKRDIGDWFTPEPRLYVGDDDRTHAVRRLEQADEALGRVLRDTALGSVPRFKVLCFDDTLPGWLDRPFPFDEVWVTWSHHLVEPMLATVDHQPAEVADLARALDQVLVPAS